MWYLAFADVRIDGQPAAAVYDRALRYRRDGHLSHLVEPPWTPALLDGLDVLEQAGHDMEAWRASERKREREVEQRRKARQDEARSPKRRR